MKRVALRGLLDEKDAITLQAKAATNERVAELDTEVSGRRCNLRTRAPARPPCLRRAHPFVCPVAVRQLASFEADLRSRGDFEIGGGFKIGDEVAARINEAENLWILCRITQFFSLASQYEVSDIEDTTKRYTLPADYIVLIPEEGSDDVMAHRFQKVSAITGMCSCRPQRRAHPCLSLTPACRLLRRARKSLRCIPTPPRSTRPPSARRPSDTAAVDRHRPSLCSLRTTTTKLGQSRIGLSHRASSFRCPRSSKGMLICKHCNHKLSTCNKHFNNKRKLCSILCSSVYAYA